MWVFWACPWWFFFWWFQLLYYLNVFFSSLFLPHCSNEDFTKQGQGISVEYRIYLSLLEFHLCMYITNTIYMHPWHLPTVSTLWCANSPFFIKLVRYYCIYYNYIYLHCGLHFFRFLIFREKRRKNEKTYIHVCILCMMRSEEKAAIVDITDYYQKMHKNASKHYARTCYTKLF